MIRLNLLTLLLIPGFLINAQIQIIAHRGASYLAPENTCASANLAWELGADAVEIDIYLSSDNRIMVMHDANTKRTSGENYALKNTHSSVLRTLDVGSFKDQKYRGEKIPFIEEIIQTIPENKELVVEIKTKSEILPFLKKSIKKYGKKKKYQFICFDVQTIIDTKQTFKKYPCYWLCSNTEVLKNNIKKIADAKVNGISLRYNIIDEEVIKMAEELNLEVYTWTVNDVEEAKRLMKLGVKGITTDRPGWLREQLF